MVRRFSGRVFFHRSIFSWLILSADLLHAAHIPRHVTPKGVFCVFFFFLFGVEAEYALTNRVGVCVSVLFSSSYPINLEGSSRWWFRFFFKTCPRHFTEHLFSPLVVSHWRECV